MPGSGQIIGGGSVPGLTLKAWAIFNGAATGTNAPLKGAGVTSVTRNSVGNYSLVLSSALSDTSGLVDVRVNNSGNWTSNVTGVINTTTGVGIYTNSADPSVVYVGIYG